METDTVGALIVVTIVNGFILILLSGEVSEGYKKIERHYRQRKQRRRS